MRPYLSLVIPTYTVTRELEEMTEICILSYRNQVDEIIIIEDGGQFSLSLQRLADTYIYHKDNRGFTKNLNCGWKIAQGEYVALVNSDTHLVSGNLRDLCVPGKVTSPKHQNQDFADVETRLSGAFFVVPQHIAQERGLLDEHMRTWGSDTEYEYRVADIFEKQPSVIIFHEISATSKVKWPEGEDREEDVLMYEKIRKSI